LALGLLGAFRVQRDGVEVARRLSPKSQALVAFVVLRGEGADRSRLAGTLWPGSPEGQARTNLRKAIYELRHEVPELHSCLEMTGRGLAWRTGGGVRVDVAEFRSLAAVPTLGSLQQAEALYRGPLLPALSDIWLVEEREALHLDYQRVLRALVGLYEGRGELRHALERAEVLARADPLADEAHLRLFELAARLGERGVLERAWWRHRRSLGELGLGPTPTVVEAYEEARAAPRTNPGRAGQGAGLPQQGAPGGEGPRLFGRDEHLEQLRLWLGATSAKVLVLTGVPGVGKSALLGAFTRELARHGRPFVTVDGGVVPPTPEGFRRALGARGHAGALEWANRRGAILLFDNFDDMGLLGRYLADELLPALGDGARLVVSARSADGQLWPLGSPARALVQGMELPELDKAEAVEYLAYRGVGDKNVAAGVVGRVGTTPLALSVAADLVIGLKPGQAWPGPVWRPAVAGLLDVWLRGVGHDTRELVSLSSVVRELDQEMLGALAGRPVTREEFLSLARLPGSRATEAGLRLHEGFRRFLAEDLDWRAPVCSRQLRLSALDEYQRRLAAAAPAWRERIAAEHLSLSQDAIVSDLLFCPEDEGQVYSERGRPGQVDELEAVLGSWGDQRMELPRPERMVAATRAIFTYRGTLLRVVRRQGDGAIVGLAVAVPICEESVELLLAHPGIEPYVRQRWAGRAGLPELPPQGTAFHFTHAAYREGLGGTSRAARSRLLREIVGLLARGGTYSLSTPDREYQALAEALGFQRVTEARHAVYGRHHMCEHYELDLTEVGFIEWANALLRPGCAVSEGAEPNALPRRGGDLRANKPR
jgi:DNA-binding SARP family transcriptional activator